MNCFGRDFRLEGHSRVPDPPDRITGLILIMSPEPEARSSGTNEPVTMDAAPNGAVIAQMQTDVPSFAGAL